MVFATFYKLIEYGNQILELDMIHRSTIHLIFGEIMINPPILDIENQITN
jgi:hypothetical protein